MAGITLEVSFCLSIAAPGLNTLCGLHERWPRVAFRFGGVSVQNEPEAATPWESCQWTGDEEASFIRDFLGPAVRQAELDLKIVAVGSQQRWNVAACSMHLQRSRCLRVRLGNWLSLVLGRIR